jgi:hypothetical protein
MFFGLEMGSTVYIVTVVSIVFLYLQRFMMHI